VYFVSHTHTHTNTHVYIYIQRNPIPKEYPSWNCFTILHDNNQGRLKEMVDKLGVIEGGTGTHENSTFTHTHTHIREHTHTHTHTQTYI
jgi:hypothetical protein